MGNAAHQLFLEGATNRNTGTLNTDPASTIHYVRNDPEVVQEVFTDDNYAHLILSGGSPKQIWGGGNMQINSSLQIMNPTTLTVQRTANGEGLSFTSNGPTSVLGWLRMFGGNSNQGILTYNNLLYIGATGRFTSFDGAKSPLLDLNGDIENYGQMVLASDGIQCNAAGINIRCMENITLSSGITNGGMVLNGSMNINTAANKRLVWKQSGYQIRIADGVQLTNEGTLENEGEMVGLTGSSTFKNSENATYIHRNANPPMSTGVMAATSNNNTVVFDASLSSQTIPAVDYYHVSVVGANAAVFNGNSILAGSLYHGGTADLQLSNTANQLVQIQGNIEGSGNFGFHPSANNQRIVLNGSYLNTGNLLTNNSATFVYESSSNQLVKPTDYPTLELGGGGTKALSGALRTTGNLRMNGAVLSLSAAGTVELQTPGALVEEVSAFGSLNCVVSGGASNKLYISGNIPGHFVSKILPLASSTAYAPITISGMPGAVPAGKLGFAVTDFAASYSEYVAHNLDIDNQLVAITSSFNYNQTFPMGSVIGNPATLFRNGSPSDGVVAQTGAGVFEVTSAMSLPLGNSQIQIYTPTENLYRSVAATFNWDAAIANWQQSLDNGASWGPASNIPGAVAETYSVIIQNNNQVALTAPIISPPENISLVGVNAVLDCGNFAFTVNKSTVVQGELRANGSGPTISLKACTIAHSGRVISTNNNAFEFIKYLKNDGVFYSAANEVEFNTSSEVTLSGVGTFQFFGVRLGANVLNQATELTISGVVTDDLGGGVWKNDAFSKLTFKGGPNFWSSASGVLDLTTTGNTFEYAANTQQNIEPATYYHLSLSAEGNLSAAPFKETPAELMVMGDLIVDAYYNFGSSGEMVTVLGNLLGVANISLGVSSRLYVGGNFDHTGPMDNTLDDIIHYIGTSDQRVKPFNYIGPVRMSGGGDKVLVGNVCIGYGFNSTFLDMAGARVVLGDFNLLMANASLIAEGVTFSHTNHIETNGLGMLGSASTALPSLYPIGSNGYYAPVTGASFNVSPYGSPLYFRTSATPAPDQTGPTSALNRHWVSSCVGGEIINGTYEFNYIDPTDIQGPEISYVSGYKAGSNAWQVGIPGIDFTNNRITIIDSNAGGNSLMIFSAAPPFSFGVSKKYRTINVSTDWRNPLHWQESNDGVNWNAASSYPGQSETGHDVIIQHNTILSAGADVFPIKNLSITGGVTLTLNDDLEILGVTSISGADLDAGVGVKVVFKDKLVGVLGLGSQFLGTTHFYQGFTTTGADLILNATTFTGSNQTISASNFVTFNQACTIDSDVEVEAYSQSPGYFDFIADVNGINSNSTLRIASGSLMKFGQSSEPMSVGNLIANANGATVEYYRAGNQVIKSTDYHVLKLIGAQTRALTGNTKCWNLEVNGGTLLFPTAASELSVDNNVSGTTIEFDMSTGAAAHGLKLGNQIVSFTL